MKPEQQPKRITLIAPYDNENKQIKCPFIGCFGGLGLAGMGRCALRGMWWSISCPEYLDENEEIERWRKNDRAQRLSWLND